MRLGRSNNPLPRLALMLIGATMGMAALSWIWVQSHNSPASFQPMDFLSSDLGRASQGTLEQVEELQDRLSANPKDWQAYSQLGIAYLQFTRESADPAYYSKAEQAFHKALDLEPEDYVALGGLGALALARHHFSEALEWGLRARQINPGRTYAYGVIADAQIELGQYKEAIETLQTMVDLRPDMSSYSRISYLRELYGDTSGAVEIMQRAVDGGIPNMENAAWTRTQLGNLFFNLGELDRSELEYRHTLKDHPRYPYAMAGIARVFAARGDDKEAIERLELAIEVAPMPEFIILMAEINEANGQIEAAQQQYQLLGAIEKLFRVNGVDLDLEMALYKADHDIDLEDTLEEARRGYRIRPSIYAADVVAWALYKTGQCGEAQRFSKESLRLGTKDALKFFHAGMIAYCLGNLPAARLYLEEAVALNPYFSFRYAPLARQTLDQLGAISSKE